MLKFTELNISNISFLLTFVYERYHQINVGKNFVVKWSLDLAYLPLAR